MNPRASACGKIILLGEHAVVYGYSAVAAPVSGLRARAELAPLDSGFLVEAPGIGLRSFLADLPSDHPLGFCVRHTAGQMGFPIPAARLRIESDIPVASGLGSGAAVSTAIVRVMAQAAGKQLTPRETSRMVFEVERIYHGTPSGVDNTVIAYEQPIRFRRGEEPVPLTPGKPLHFLIADSGLRGETRVAVGGVRQRREQDPERYDRLFREMGALAELGVGAVRSGDIPALGRAMDECHGHLRDIGVSLPLLDGLVEAARRAGARGAKLSGAGLGGNVLALVEPEQSETVTRALREAGAAEVYPTVVTGH